MKPSAADPTRTLIRDLPEGALDLVGDVHGELAALRTLLGHLGYTADGRHPEGRRLVFLGDLVDRGPSSVSTVRLVAELVAAGRAFAVLGNHDLNLLRGARKIDNGWFYGEPQRIGAERRVVESEIATEADRRAILGFYRSLPLAMRRPDLRVVHAAWSDEAVVTLAGAGCAMEAFRRAAAGIDAELGETDPNGLEAQLAHQNRNPVKLLTSGPEGPAEAAGVYDGVVRRTRRLPWWLEEEDDRPLCVVGHYGRPLRPAPGGLFAGLEPEEQLGPTAMCIDFRVSDRPKLRLRGEPLDTVALAALR